MLTLYCQEDDLLVEFARARTVREDAYYRRHAGVVSKPLLDTGATEEEMRDAAVKEAYLNHLHQLGLIKPPTRGRGPDQITQLGRMLLEQIDFYQREPAT